MRMGYPRGIGLSEERGDPRRQRYRGSGGHDGVRIAVDAATGTNDVSASAAHVDQRTEPPSGISHAGVRVGEVQVISP